MKDKQGAVINEKLSMMLNEFLNQIDTEYRDMFRELAEFAIKLGYKPQKTKTKLPGVIFFNRMTKQSILRLESNADSDINNGAGIRLKFYATETYSQMFRNSIKKVIEEFNGRYTACYGCGKCKSGIQGYSYVYDDGKTVFRCGTELISLQGFEKKHIEEIKTLLFTQAEYFIK
jgi:hypothetical protein